MCGRFTLTVPTYEELAEAFGVPPIAGFAEVYRPRYNVAPTDTAWVLRMYRGVRELVSSEWGLVPRWSKTKKQAGRPINARSETLETKPLFRDSFERRRCVVAADGFFEWDKTDGGRVPYWFRPAGGGLLLMAGIWDHWVDEASSKKVCTFTILTTSASDDVAPLHDRMPVILARRDLQTWIDAHPDDSLGVTSEVRALLRPSDPGTLTKVRVSSRVSSVKNDDPECLLEGGPDDREPSGRKASRTKRSRPEAPTLPLFEQAPPRTSPRGSKH